MSRFNLANVAHSVGNFIFGSKTNMNDEISGNSLEPTLLDDILGIDFDAKTDMMDLFTPTASTTEDILDKLIRELDKEEGRSEEQNVGFRACSSEFAQDFGTPSSFNVDDHKTLYENCHDAVRARSTQEIGPYYEAPDSYVEYIESSKRSSVEDCATGQDFFYEGSLPQLAETVEVELSHEHSYASNQQRYVEQERNGVKSRAAVGSTSPLSFSSAESARNSFSLSPDEDRHSVLFKGSKKAKADYISAAFKYASTRHRDRYDDNEDDFAEFYSVETPDELYGGYSNAMLKRGIKRRSGRSHFLYPFSKSDSRRDEKCPALLMLSEEERQLCEKEGVKLPVKFPLTKQEERELRRIRRKIRNKRSAQESRRKKHEYISSLEERVRAGDHDNLALRRQVEVLSKNNKTLAEQVKKLQTVVNNGTTKPAIQAGTCLAVLLLSFALLVAPNYDLFGGQKGRKMTGNKFQQKLEHEEQQQSSANIGVKSTDRLMFAGNTRILNPGEEYETPLNVGEMSPSSSSLSSFVDGGNWSSSSNFDLHSSSTRSADENDFNVDDSGGGSFNWTPAFSGANSYNDWPFTNIDVEGGKVNNWIYSSVEPALKRPKIDIDNMNVINPLIAQFAFENKDNGLFAGDMLFGDIEPEADRSRNRTRLLLNRRKIKLEDA